MRAVTTVASLVLLALSQLIVLADEPSESKERPAPAGKAAKSGDESNQQHHEQFTKLLSNVKLVGRFTVLGKEDDKLSKEEYTIHKVEKLAEGDKWMFHCRIKYGKHDLSLPLPIDVKWAGDTPIITLNDLTIPGLGTFSSRVVLHEKKYAGTWSHDEVGGHLFGVIEPAEKSAEAPETSR